MKSKMKEDFDGLGRRHVKYGKCVFDSFVSE